MKTANILLKVLMVSSWAVSTGLAGTITWSLPVGGSYTSSSGASLPDGYQFQLGVFTNGFVPLASNAADWKDNWTGLTVGEYNSTLSALSESYQVDDNPAPFTKGVQLYCMGFKVTASGSSEVFLATDSSWEMPDSAPLGLPVDWDINSAETVIVGSAGSSPDTIQTVSVDTDKVPSRSYGMWLLEHFSVTERSNPLVSGPRADADGDGSANAVEYFWGTNPREYLKKDLAIERVNGTIRVSTTFDPTSDVVATFQKSVDLTTGGWSTATSGRNMVAGEMWLSEASANQLFWRLVVTVSP